MNRRTALAALGALPLTTTIEAKAEDSPKLPPSIEDPEGLLDERGIEWAHCIVNLARISATSPGSSIVFKIFTFVSGARRFVEADLESSNPSDCRQSFLRISGMSEHDVRRAVNTLLFAHRYDGLIGAAAATKVKVGNRFVTLARDEFLYPRRTVQTLERAGR